MARLKADIQPSAPPRRIRFRRIFLSVIAILIVALIWIFWPIYGFISNQYETARLPWGWEVLPADMPRDVVLKNPDYAEASAKAIEILEARRAKIDAPSLSAAITVEGELVWAGATGWADVKNKIPATVQTTYRIGSTSKAVEITGLARLVGAGIIDLDAPISTYAADLPNPAWQNFTARQLASHTAGLPGYEENNDRIGLYQSMALTSRYTDPKDALSVFDTADVLFEPSDNFHYSSFDNVLLSAVMQDATGHPFNDLMSARVFDPIGMEATMPDYLRGKNLPFALSYQTKGDEVKPWRKVDLSHKLAGGGYISTPSDLARLGAAWLDEDFISSDVRDVFWTLAKLSDGSVNEDNYALGFRRNIWLREDAGNVVYLNHGGISKGAQCWLMIVPEYDLTLAISVNRRTDQFFEFGSVFVDLLEVFMPASASPPPL